MELAYFMAEDENKEFKEKMREIFDAETNYVWWIGGTDLGNNKVFYWINSGIDIGYSDYMRYNPSHYNKAGLPEKCLAMHAASFQWNDECCDKENYFVCRRDLKNLTDICY